MEKFGRTIWKYRKQYHNITIRDLADLTGVSYQYINGIENKNKFTSIDLLRNLALILSQEQSVIKELIERKEKIEPLCVDETDKLDLYKSANPDILFDILLKGTKLSKFKDKITFVNKAISQFEVSDSLTNKLSQLSFDEINHDYQIWTITDLMGEAISEKAARETAERIVKYKIKHCYFIPFDDYTKWKEGIFEVSKLVKEMLHEKKHKENWKGANPLEDYLRVYGISSVAFFSRCRIYNVKSENAVGNYNIGGTTIEESKLADMPTQLINEIRKKLQIIISADNINELEKGKRKLIEELGSYAIKKYPTPDFKI